MWKLPEDRWWKLSEGATASAQVLRLLKVLGAGNAEASDQMSDILAQVRWSRPADLAGLWATKKPSVGNEEALSIDTLFVSS